MSTTVFLKNHILEKLSSGPRNVSALVFEISQEHKTTIQGVYKALRHFTKDEVITIHRRTASLSVIWITEQKEKLERTAKAYELTSYLQQLQDSKKRRMSFTFKTLAELDLFWTHSLLIIQESLPASHVSYAIAPHDWFFYSRTSTDTAWTQKHSKEKRVFRAILTHAQALDKKVIEKRHHVLGKSLEHVFNENPLRQKETEYYNIIDSWLFHIILDPHVSKELSLFIEKQVSLAFTKEIKKEMGELLARRGRFTLSIEKSEKKTSVVRKKILGYFE